MATIPENTTNPILRPVTRLEVTTKVFGGEYIPDDEQQRGVSNLQAIELAERDQYIISRVGEAYIPESGDIPAEVGIAPLDSSGKLPKTNNTANVVYTSDTQTLTNKTLALGSNHVTTTAGKVVVSDSHGDIGAGDIDSTKLVSTDNTKTLTNKTIDAKDNSLLCTPTVYATPTTLSTFNGEMNIVISAALTLGSGPYVGYNIPVTATSATTVSYTGANGATSDDLDAGQTVNYIWKGSYWGSVSNAALLVYISEDTTVAPTMPMNYIVDTANVTLTLDDGAYPTCRVDVYAQQDCYVSYTGEGGTTVTDTLHAGDYLFYTWLDTYWKYQSVPVLGVDDNKEAFGFNIESMVRAGETAHITGTDADGNSFEYGIENLITKCEEQSYQTTEVKTNQTWIDGKPIYRKVIPFTTPNATTAITPSTGISNGFLISCTGFVVADNNYTYVMNLYHPTANSGNFINALTDCSALYFITNDAHCYNRQAYAIIEYTKTTD